MANLIHGLWATASPFDATKRIVRPDGEVRYIRCVGAPVLENQRLKKYLGSAIDVTEHELVTQELRRREAYLAEAQRLSYTGSFGWKPDSGEIVWSDETYRIFEYDSAVSPTIDAVLQRIHPQPIPVDVRVIAATNRDLNAAAATGTFRQDLLYRLNVFPIEMPPLRERKDDILILVEYFVQRYANRAGKNIRLIDQKTLDLLQSYDWPGNIRELQNIIERSIILSSTDVFSVDELWLSKRTSPQPSWVEASPALRAADLQKNVEPRSEREIIEAALAETRGRVSGPSGAATKLRIPPSTLETRIKALKINKKQFKFG